MLDRIREEIRSKRTKEKPEKVKGLSTGCRLLNLSLTGNSNYGIFPGEIHVWIGASSSGKTWLLTQTLAEAANNPRFDDYDLYLEDVEKGSKMDRRRFFGNNLVERLKPLSPKGTSATLEEFYYNVDTVASRNTPFILGLDSEDALSSDAEKKKFKQQKKAHEKEESAKGSYGDGKAKKNAAGLRVTNNSINQSGSMVVIIKQEKDNIGQDAFFRPKVYSGGRSLKYFATCEVWFSPAGNIKDRILGKDRIVGHYIKINVQKTRQAGWNTTIKLRFYPSYGIDEIGSLIDYLIDEGVWKRSGGDQAAKKSSGVITADDFDFQGKEEKLIQKIEKEGLEKDLGRLVSRRWREVREACSIQRKPRYE